MVLFSGLFDTLFGFTLNWPPVYAIILISFILSVLSIVATKVFTDQKEMKRLKTELNEFQKKAKSLHDQPGKMLEVQKEMMKTNMEYMRKSMKVTFIMFIPMILILGWMGAHFAYHPIAPGTEFDVIVGMKKDIVGNVSITVPDGLESLSSKVVEIKNQQADFKLKGNVGSYILTFASNDDEVDKVVLITNTPFYSPVEELYKSSEVFNFVKLGNEKLIVIWKLSWLWAYLICMIAFSLAMRKVFKVY